MIGVSGISNINKGEGGIQSIAYAIEDFLLDTVEHIRSSFSLVSLTLDPEGPSPTPDQKCCCANVLMVVVAVALVAVMTWLSLTGTFSQGGIYPPLTTPIPNMYCPKLMITLNPTTGPTFKNILSPLLRLTISPRIKLTIHLTMRPTLRLTGSTYLIPNTIPTISPELRPSLRTT